MEAAPGPSPRYPCVEMVKGAKLKVYKGGAHGMCTTETDAVNEDLLAFIKG